MLQAGKASPLPRLNPRNLKPDPLLSRQQTSIFLPEESDQPKGKNQDSDSRYPNKQPRMKLKTDKPHPYF